MSPTEHEQDENQRPLGWLFAAYREACPDTEGSPNFMPRVWEAIEQSRPVSWIFPMRLWAQRLLMGATLATAMLISYLAVLQKSTSTVDILEASYVDVLTAESLDDIDAEFWHLAENGR